ncbi:MAG: transposase [Spirochaetales bacterium]|nr:transposase [Spirochaetales bacterium]MBQ2295289.1 transposase [Spirochaetales bacterium]
MTYSKEFKQQAIKLSDEIGTQKACEQLGLSYFTLGGWRKKENRKRIMDEETTENTSVPLTEREKKLMKEIEELREANNILKDAFSFFVNDRKR